MTALPTGPTPRARHRRLRFGLATVLGLAPRGFFIPYRYAAGLDEPPERDAYPALAPLFDAARGTMDALFVSVMLWAKARGYRWFSLGMAPLAGLESSTVAPLWVKLGAFLYRHGEAFYNFQGLRQFKNKFDPEWRPRYLVYPGGLVLPRVLASIRSAP